MAQKNIRLTVAKKRKSDEFYTQLTDIEKEMVYYKPHFKGKVIFCNCDDARESNFFKYFANNFELLGIRKLITTGYKENGHGVVLEYEGDKNNNLMVDPNEIKVTELKGNGDFRSDECIEYLKQADIVITNPPFSLFREYIALLMEYKKNFIIMGNMNAITYKEVFPYIKENKLWLGVSIHSGDRKFKVPDSYILPENNGEINEKGEKFIKVSGIRWFTNIPHDRLNIPIDLYKIYSPSEFPKYDNYDAINVDKTCDIPIDYYGVMGVPISFLDKYCPAQFEIVGATESEGKGFSNGLFNDEYKITQPLINGSKVYKRLFIRRLSSN